jgi:glycosyltransferase involved in cell wall biosynthesis
MPKGPRLPELWPTHRYRRANVRVLFVNDFGAGVGGSERVVADERVVLERRGHVTELVTAGGEEARARRLTAPSRALDQPARALSGLLQLHNPPAAWAVERAAVRFAPDVIHFHNVRALSAAVLGEADRRPAVLTLHDYALMHPRVARLYPADGFCGVGHHACCREHAGSGRYAFELVRTALHRRALRAVRRILVPSHYMLEVAERIGLPRVTCCPNGVRQIGPAPYAGRGIELLYAGRLEEEKGVFALLPAFELAADRLPDVRLALAGHGTGDARLRSAVTRSRHAGRIAILGQLTEMQLARRYGAARAVLVPSLWPEPFGLSGVEAMSTGAPVVGSGRGGIGEWLHDDRDGLVADPEDREAFAAALVRISTDAPLHARLSRGALDTAAALDIDRHVDRLEAIYAEATAPAGTPGAPGITPSAAAAARR